VCSSLFDNNTAHPQTQSTDLCSAVLAALLLPSRPSLCSSTSFRAEVFEWQGTKTFLRHSIILTPCLPSFLPFFPGFYFSGSSTFLRCFWPRQALLGS